MKRHEIGQNDSIMVKNVDMEITEIDLATCIYVHKGGLGTP